MLTAKVAVSALTLTPPGSPIRIGSAGCVRFCTNVRLAAGGNACCAFGFTPSARVHRRDTRRRSGWRSCGSRVGAWRFCGGGWRRGGGSPRCGRSCRSSYRCGWWNGHHHAHQWRFARRGNGEARARRGEQVFDSAPLAFVHRQFPTGLHRNPVADVGTYI